MRGRGLGSAAGTICAAVVLAACGGGSDDGEPDAAAVAQADAGVLLDYLPTDPAQIRVVDLAAAREELGLPADSDASVPGGGDPRAHLEAAASAVIPYLSLPRPRPVQDAIDHGAITAAAGNVVEEPDGLTAVATRQPFEDVAGRLVTEGYRRQGDLLESDSSFVQGSYGVIADAGGGVIVLGYRRDTVERAIEDTPGEGNPARPLIGEVEGTARAAAAHDGLDCIEGIAVGASADLERGEILIEVDGKASTERFRLTDALALPEYGFRDLGVERDALTAGLTVDPQSGSPTPPTELADPTLDADEIYAC